MLVRFVNGQDDIVWDGFLPRVSPASFSRDDIRGAKGKDSKKRSISTFRHALTPRAELFARARAYTLNQGWCSDPVVAIGEALNFRSIRDDNGRRELCVYAEPLDEPSDPHGPCPTHAGLRRSDPVRRDAQRMDLLMMRDRIASCFGPLGHLACAGFPPRSVSLDEKAELTASEEVSEQSGSPN